MKTERFTGLPKPEYAEDATAGRIERRLVAILAADVAGYSRLVGADEQGTLTQWKAHWDELIAPKMQEFGGRTVRITGDGLLAEFASAVNAVRYAAALQRGMAERNAHIPPEKRIEFRVGLNVGDVIIDRGDMWGEGVNVAARLEALAQPGGICVSGRLHEDVRGKLDIAFEDMGKHQLKNIARPIRVFRVHSNASARAVVVPLSRNQPAIRPAGGGALHPERENQVPGEAGPAPARRRTKRRLLFAAVIIFLAAAAAGVAWWLASSGRLVVPLATGRADSSTRGSTASPANGAATPALSIVVLPFSNLGGDAGQDYVADGITDSLTSDLSRALPGSFVVPRDTAFAYKGGPEARQIGQELAVRYLLAGSVLPDGDRLRINARLVDTKDGSQLWAERFDAERESILQVQDEIVGRLVRAVGLEVIDIEARRSARERPSSAEAIDLVMRGRATINRPSSAATMIEARDFFERVLQIEPDSVDGLAGVATTLVFEFLNGYYQTGGEERLRRADMLLDRALTIEARHLMALKARSALLRAQGKFDGAIAAAEAVILANPGEPWAYKEIGLSTLYLGRAEKALDWFAKADRFGPLDPGRWTWLDSRGQALILLGRDEEAIRALTGAVQANPKNVTSQGFLAAAYALIGRPEEARAALARYDQVHPGARVSTFRLHSPVPLALTSAKYREQYERLKEGLRKAGMAP
jgi:adenylate cyclase